MIKKLIIVLNTLKYLKISQIFYQVKYRLIKSKGLLYYSNTWISEKQRNEIVFSCFPPVDNMWDGYNGFIFLNLRKDFSSRIDWGFQEYGKLWNYNLQYCNYLLQKDISVEAGKNLIKSLYSALSKQEIKLEPYTVSLRVINIIRFINYHKINDKEITQSLYGELRFLSERMEYHILGNHLLENAFALCMGGAFFDNSQWYNMAVKVISKELRRQILSDGAHFELSPMYHSIIFFRILELLDWYGAFKNKDEEFWSFCKEVASYMRSWLENISFTNGDLPLFNDSAKNIAYPFEWLLSYASNLGIDHCNLPLGESGYRVYRKDRYEIAIDFAQIGASYQPGHGHADALSFILYFENRPFFVEQGTSTYNVGFRRDLERSTEAHNTVVVNGVNQSEVWGGFRVGRRAFTSIHKEEENYLEASHNGYKRFGITHKRSFQLYDDHLVIFDELTNAGNGVFILHCYPGCEIIQSASNSLVINDKVKLSFDGQISLNIDEYNYSDCYNRYKTGKRIIASFKEKLTSRISFELCI